VTRAILVIVGLTLFGTIVSATQPSSTPAANTTVQAAPVITHKTDVQTSSIPYESTTQYDATKTSGTSTITTTGVDGVETKTYDVTLTDGVETSRSLTSDVTTTAPITQVTTIGTYVTPSCTNGSYINSAGNRVCSPETSSSTPAGATAQCSDGTYSFSQSRSGTCSHHGGVAVWL
jgi:hypothetical protein